MLTPSLFSRFLTALGVPHTVEYSDRRFQTMPFSSLFGLGHLLTSYGVPNQGYRLTDKSQLAKIPTPYLAQTSDGTFVIVNAIDDVSGRVTYDLLKKQVTSTVAEFEQLANGVVLLAWPDAKSAEPQYREHHVKDVVQRLSKPLMYLGALFVAAYFFITNHVYAHWPAVLSAALSVVGLVFSYMLTQKTLGIHTAASERVCGVIEEGGCDAIAGMKASKLFGVFAWSEVGLAYFGVTLAVILALPQMWPAAAVCNVFCLPYSFWSVWYQKFRARKWCTLCLGVQTTLWLIFFSLLGGGYLAEGFRHFDLATVVLMAVYATAAVGVNIAIRTLTNLPAHATDSSSAA